MVLKTDLPSAECTSFVLVHMRPRLQVQPNEIGACISDKLGHFIIVVVVVVAGQTLI